MNRDDRRILLVAAVLAIALALAGAALADDPKLPAGVTCELVRAKVAEHGRVIAYAWARLQGYSRAEINEARKCLR